MLHFVMESPLGAAPFNRLDISQIQLAAASLEPPILASHSKLRFNMLSLSFVHKLFVLFGLISLVLALAPYNKAKTNAAERFGQHQRNQQKEKSELLAHRHGFDRRQAAYGGNGTYRF